MNVLLTGATGFLGSHLARGLLREGHDVAVIIRRTSDTRRIADILPLLTVCYLEDGIRPVFEVGHPIDAVIHAATLYGQREDSLSDILAANVSFPLQLLETALFSGVPLFINTDTFFSKTGDDYVYLDAYILSKRQFSQWCRKIAGKGVIRVVTMVLEHLYGPGDNESKFVSTLMRSLLADVPALPMTPGEQRRDFIFVDDVVSAYLTVLRHSQVVSRLDDEYDVGTGESHSVRCFAETARELCRAHTELLFGALPYRVGEIMESKADCRLLHMLGWQATVGLREGIQMTCAASGRELAEANPS